MLNLIGTFKTEKKKKRRRRRRKKEKQSELFFFFRKQVYLISQFSFDSEEMAAHLLPGVKDKSDSSSQGHR